MAKVIESSWELAEDVTAKLVRIIEENSIDENTLSKMTPDLVKEMIPQVGLRIMFLNKWTAIYGQRNNGSDTEPDEICNDNVGEKNISSVVDELALKRDHAFVGKTMFALRTKSINIRSILNRTLQGQAILQSYTKMKTLTKKCRNVIVDVILSDILSQIPRLTNCDFEYLAEAIIKLFPTESSATYYVPPIPKRHSRLNRSMVSRGKLVDKYRNKIREFKSLTQKTLSSNQTALNDCEDIAYGEDNQAVLDATSWLQKHTEPWEVVITNWGLTQNRRFEENKKEESKVNDIFDRWPILKHPRGYELIEEDFVGLYPSIEKLTVEKWEAFFQQVQAITRFNKTDTNASALNKLLEVVENEDSKVVLQLLLLSHAIPPKGRVRTKKGQWKPSINECKDSIIQHATLAADTILSQEKRSAAMLAHGLTVQPFIIAIGPTLSDVSTFYVSIDKVLYKVSSALQAVEVCFKSFHSLYAIYPPESEHLWMILQKGLFQLSTKWDKMAPYVTEIVTEISRADKERNAS